MDSDSYLVSCQGKRKYYKNACEITFGIPAKESFFRILIFIIILGVSEGKQTRL